jgi:hypothetical protein
MIAMIGLRRTTASALIAVILISLAAPGAVCAGTPADDLKQIEYKYYFRGKYQQTIESLQTFLARVDLTAADATRAREFLAASYVLGGAPAMGKDVFLQMLANNPTYGGPDPTVFKLDVMNIYGEARSEHAAMVLKNAPPSGEPATAAPSSAESAASTPEKQGKPIYKKWWLYAGAAAVLLAAGAAAGGKDEGNGSTTTSGGVAVGVTIR